QGGAGDRVRQPPGEPGVPAAAGGRSAAATCEVTDEARPPRPPLRVGGLAFWRTRPADHGYNLPQPAAVAELKARYISPAIDESDAACRWPGNQDDPTSQHFRYCWEVLRFIRQVTGRPGRRRRSPGNSSSTPRPGRGSGFPATIRRRQSGWVA